MYVYRIKNLINGKEYYGITNNYKRRWCEEKRYPSNKKYRQVIQEAIHKHGVENFSFEVLKSNLSIEDAVKMEEQLIAENNSTVPNGYNVDKGGSYFPKGKPHKGEKNGRAKISDEEAQSILDNRDKPMYVLYEDYSDKISYAEFKEIYKGNKFKHLKTKTQPYPYNLEFSSQFASTAKLEYDEVIQLRISYSKGVYWEDVYPKYKDLYPNKWEFWNVYVGNRYHLVMPEVFTEENKKKHAKMGKRGERNSRAKLKESDVLLIREKWKNGSTRKEIYELFPQVSTTSIRNVINNKTWKNLL